MADEPRPSDGQPTHPEVRHEPRDVSLGAIVLILICAGFCGVVVLVLVYGHFARLRDDFAVDRKTRYPLHADRAPMLPPEPRLQSIDRLEKIDIPNVAARLKAKEAVLHSYGSASEKGYVRVPVERAMDALAGKLPARRGPSDPRTHGLVDFGEPNSGRLFRKEAPWYAR